MGSGEAAAREYLTENYKEEMPFEDVIKLALNTLKESIDEEPTRENIRLSYIKAEDKRFHEASKDEVEKFLNLIKEESKESKESKA